MPDAANSDSATELRIPHREVVASRMPTLHPWLWAAGKTAKDVAARWYDVRTCETVLVLR